MGTRLDTLVKDYSGLAVEPGNFIGRILGSIIDFLIDVETCTANGIRVETPNQGTPNDEESFRILGEDRSRNPEARPQFRHLPLEFLE